MPLTYVGADPPCGGNFIAGDLATSSRIRGKTDVTRSQLTIGIPTAYLGSLGKKQDGFGVLS